MIDVKCSECDGRGAVDVGISTFDEDPEETCQVCEGKARVDQRTDERATIGRQATALLNSRYPGGHLRDFCRLVMVELTATGIERYRLAELEAKFAVPQEIASLQNELYACLSMLYPFGPESRHIMMIATLAMLSPFTLSVKHYSSPWDSETYDGETH